MPPMTGRVIAGRYNLQHPIGRGAMGVVWRARDQLLDRDVAIKEVVISALIGEDERRNAYQRTLREARTAARLSHRGVVAVYDVAEEDGRPWIVMELVPSQSLDQILVVEGRLRPVRVGRIGQQLLSALAAAHSAGVLHRDVKPSNVLVATNRGGDGWEERAVLTDFGIAQFEGDPRLTQTGMVMGSPGFTAPERIRGSDATPASDLWSLGATLYAAVEGRGPYEQRGGAITTMSAIINEDAPVAPHAGHLAPVIAALLRRDPASRPSALAAMRMFAQALPRVAEVAEEPAPASHPPTIRSTYMAAPAAAVATPVTTPENARDGAEPALGPVRYTAQESEGEPAEEAHEAAEEIGAASVAEVDQADDATPEPELEPGLAIEPEAESESAALAAESAESSEDAAESAFAEAAAPETAAALSAGLTEADRSREAEPVLPGRGPAANQPTRASVPVSRIAPPLSQPAAAPVKSAEQKLAPSFTAAKPGERFTPTFSAAAHSIRPDAPHRDQRPAYGPTGGQGPAGQGPAGQGPTGHGPIGGPGYQPSRGPAAYPPSGAAYGPPGGQYAGPAQPHPDLAAQYAPGTGGGRSRPGRGQARRMLWLLVAVIIAAAIGVGTALAVKHNGGTGNAANAGNTGRAGNSPTALPSVEDTATGFRSIDALNAPSTVLPAGWSTQTVTASQANSLAAGFSIDLPPGWTESRKGLATDFNGPNALLLEVDLTTQSSSNMLTVAKQLAAANHLHAYKLLNLQAEPVRHTEGAVWKFNWTPANGVRYTADDIFFAQQTTAGVQDYAVYIRSPSSTFSKSLDLFDQILPTFQTVPGA